MGHIYTVVRQSLLAGSPEVAWKHLTEGSLLSDWFADSGDLSSRGTIRFAFGDGDFFAGKVVEWEKPVSLHLEWRFLDVGPSFDIRFSLLPMQDRTELTVSDRGAASVEEALGLHEGWDDFLMRCEQKIRTGARTRYRWTELFGGSAFLPEAQNIGTRLDSEHLWAAYFPTAPVVLQSDGRGSLCLEFKDPEWGGRKTQAQTRIGERAGRGCLNVTHQGWGGLPEAIQVAERARYAAAWAALLKHVEQNFVELA